MQRSGVRSPLGPPNIRGCSSMVERRLPKPVTWVRFPSPAPRRGEPFGSPRFSAKTHGFNLSPAAPLSQKDNVCVGYLFISALITPWLTTSCLRACGAEVSFLVGKARPKQSKLCFGLFFKLYLYHHCLIRLIQRKIKIFYVLYLK